MAEKSHATNANNYRKLASKSKKTKGIMLHRKESCFEITFEWKYVQIEVNAEKIILYVFKIKTKQNKNRIELINNPKWFIKMYIIYLSLRQKSKSNL